MVFETHHLNAVLACFPYTRHGWPAGPRAGPCGHWTVNEAHKPPSPEVSSQLGGRLHLLSLSRGIETNLLIGKAATRRLIANDNNVALIWLRGLEDIL